MPLNDGKRYSLHGVAFRLAGALAAAVCLKGKRAGNMVKILTPRLHLCCGDKYLKGWTNHDGLPGKADLVGDVYRVIRKLDSGCFSQIYWSHGPEHLYPDLTPDVFKHLHRVMMTGGIIHVATIDFPKIYQARYMIPLTDGPNWQAALYGQTDSKDHPYLAHRQAFTEHSILNLLKDAGFLNVAPWTPEEVPELMALNDYATSCRLVTCYAKGTKQGCTS